MKYYLLGSGKPAARLGNELMAAGATPVLRENQADAIVTARYPSSTIQNRAQLLGIPLLPSRGRYPLTSEKSLTYESVTVPVPRWSKASCHKIHVQNYGLPYVYKGERGSCGRYVWLIRNEREYDRARHTVRPTRCIVQEYIPEAHGEALRVIYVEGQGPRGDGIVHISRFSQSGWRSNVLQGGQITTWEDEENYEKVCEVAIAAAKEIGCPIQGIDIIRPSDPLFLESNWASFEASEDACGVNIYKSIAAWTLGEYDRIMGLEEVKGDGLLVLRRTTRDDREWLEMAHRALCQDLGYKDGHSKLRAEQISNMGWIALWDGQRAGYYGPQGHDRSKSVYVLPKYRGKGIGKALVEAYGPSRVYILDSNTASQALFRSCGYKPSKKYNAGGRDKTIWVR